MGIKAEMEVLPAFNHLLTLSHPQQLSCDSYSFKNGGDILGDLWATECVSPSLSC